MNSRPPEETANAADQTHNATAASRPRAVEPAGTGEPLQGPQLPPSCGAPHRLRPDIAAALLWGPRDKWALAADRLIRLIGNAELVLVITTAWLKDKGWGLLGVTSERVVYVPGSASEDCFAQPIPSLLWLFDKKESDEHGNRKCSIVDLERDVHLWFESVGSVEAVASAIKWAVRMHTDVPPGYEKANTDNVLDEFSRFSALHRARQTGALDDNAMSSALARLFGVDQPPGPTPPRY